MGYIPPYTFTDEIVNRAASISEKIGALSVSSSSPAVPELRLVSHIRSVHSSAAIEGNTLSEDAVSDVIAGKRVVGAANEILEVRGAHAAYGKPA